MFCATIYLTDFRMQCLSLSSLEIMCRREFSERYDSKSDRIVDKIERTLVRYVCGSDCYKRTELLRIVSYRIILNPFVYCLWFHVHQPFVAVVVHSY